MARAAQDTPTATTELDRLRHSSFIKNLRNIQSTVLNYLKKNYCLIYDPTKPFDLTAILKNLYRDGLHSSLKDEDHKHIFAACLLLNLTNHYQEYSHPPISRRVVEKVASMLQIILHTQKNDSSIFGDAFVKALYEPIMGKNAKEHGFIDDLRYFFCFEFEFSEKQEKETKDYSKYDERRFRKVATAFKSVLQEKYEKALTDDIFSNATFHSTPPAVHAWRRTPPPAVTEAAAQAVTPDSERVSPPVWF